MPDVRLTSEKEEVLPRVHDVPVTDTRGTVLTLIVLNITDVSKIAPAVVLIKDEESAVIPCVPVNEMSESVRVPDASLVRK